MLRPRRSGRGRAVLGVLPAIGATAIAQGAGAEVPEGHVRAAGFLGPGRPVDLLTRRGRGRTPRPGRRSARRPGGEHRPTAVRRPEPVRTRTRRRNRRRAGVAPRRGGAQGLDPTIRPDRASRPKVIRHPTLGGSHSAVEEAVVPSRTTRRRPSPPASPTSVGTRRPPRSRPNSAVPRCSSNARTRRLTTPCVRPSLAVAATVDPRRTTASNSNTRTASSGGKGRPVPAGRARLRRSGARARPPAAGRPGGTLGRVAADRRLGPRIEASRGSG